MPDIRVEGYVTVMTEEESRKSQPVGNMGKETKIKNNLFEKSDSKHDNIIKSRLPWNEPIEENKEEFVKSKNNLLNLSILKHI